MFLAAVARPRFDTATNREFNGKIGIWPFIFKEPAKRNSKNRVAGTLETKPILSVTKEVDFIIGREIEVGGMYKGVVASVKEYGAFVEFNGGQHGLLHVSELSHEQVSRVSDVVSVGQQLSLMCIGRDVRGNLKLSLKAALPQSEKKSVVLEGSFTPMKQEPKVWASVGDVPTSQENDDSTLEELLISKDENQEDFASLLSPSIVIRSVAECEEDEISVGADKKLGLKDEKSFKPSVRNQSVSESDSKSRASPNSGILSHNGHKSSKTVSLKHKEKDFDSLFESTGSHISLKKDVNDRIKAGGETGMNANSLRLGDKVAAKVHQIRLHGLVLDLGGGIRGMYRFQSNGKKNFEVGEELLVQCSSFSGKGIPVMSLLEDE